MIRALSLITLFVASCALIAEIAPAADTVLPPIAERFQNVADDGPYPEVPNFQRHVVALLGRLGCNGRSCHGSFQGRGGFRLSMFGYDFADDHKALLAGTPPRVDVTKPSASQILLKPTNAVEHEGGQRYEQGGWEYRVLRAWIAGGAKNDADRAGKMMRIEVAPAELVFRTPGTQVQMQVIAVWSD